MAKAKKKATKKSATKKSATKKAAKKKTSVKKTSKKAAAKKPKRTTRIQAVKSSTKKVATKAKPKKVMKAAKPVASQVSLGKPVPNFSLPANGGKNFNLSDYKGKKVVLYFYPKDMTPGCTIEGKDFSCMLEDFKSANTEVFGISRDSVKSHEKFIAKEAYTVDLLSDENEMACNIFGVIKDKNMYGKMVRGIERSTFVIDENGNLSHEWRKVNVPGHAEEVLKTIKGS